MTAATKPWSLRPPWSQSWPPSSRCPLQAQPPLWTWHNHLDRHSFCHFHWYGAHHQSHNFRLLLASSSFIIIINRWSREPGIACTGMVDKCESWKDGSTGYTCWQKITFVFQASMTKALTDFAFEKDRKVVTRWYDLNMTLKLTFCGTNFMCPQIRSEDIFLRYSLWPAKRYVGSANTLDTKKRRKKLFNPNILYLK